MEEDHEYSDEDLKPQVQNFDNSNFDENPSKILDSLLFGHVSSDSEDDSDNDSILSDDAEDEAQSDQVDIAKFVGNVFQDTSKNPITSFSHLSQLKESKHGLLHNRSNGISLELLPSTITKNERIKNIGDIKKEVEKNDFSTGKLLVPDQHIIDRATREVLYNNVKEDMGKWQPLVNSNRHANTVDLVHDAREKSSIQQLVSGFSPSNTLEKKVQMVLMKNKMGSEREIEEREEDLLVGSGMR